MPLDFQDSPLLVTWELTRACALHCRHCRARAIRRRAPDELTLAEIESVLDQMTDFHPLPTLIFTGGDPLERDDLGAIVDAAVGRGFSVALAPSVTPRLTDAAIRHWAAQGVRAVSLSLDGASPAVHDGYRGVPGTFAATIQRAQTVAATGMKLQINSSVAPATRGDLPALGQLVRDLGVSSWEVFFVIPTGRARPAEALSPAEQEAALAWLARYRATVPFRVSAVGAPQFIRYTTPSGATAAPAIREARGMVFIGFSGEVYPSGYLPVSGGNVRRQSLPVIYRQSDLFRGLRDPSRLRGRCAACGLRAVCGGSRARAYALTGDPWAEDPGCASASVPVA